MNDETTRPAARACLRALIIGLLTVLLIGTQSASAALINRRLSGNIIADGDIKDNLWAISPDGQYVIFIANRLIDAKYDFELFSVPTAGGSPKRISADLAEGHDVAQMAVAGSQMVVYGVIPPTNAHMTGLYAVRVDGSKPPVALTPYLGSSGYVKSFQVSPNGQYVAYVVEDSLTTTAQDGILYLADLVGHMRTVSGCDLAITGSCGVGEDYAFTPNSAKLVYQCGGGCLEEPGLNFVDLPDGEPHFLLQGLASFKVTPDSLHVVAETTGYQLLKIGLVEPVTIVYLPYFTISDPNYAVNANSTQLVYMNNTALHTELFSVPLTGGTPVSLSPSLVTDGDVLDYKISPDGASVVFRADGQTDEIVELYGVSITGGTPVKLSGATMAGDVLSDYQFTPNGQSVVYRADQETAGTVELYVRTWGSGAPIKVSDPNFPDWGNVSEFVIFPDGMSLAYRADRETNGKFEIYGWTAFGGGNHFKISSEPMAGDAYEFAITPDNRSVVYRADQEAKWKYELWITSNVSTVYLPFVTCGD